MTKELKDKWVAALRSGTYKQGNIRLKTIKDGTESFCCLGVLCDIIDPTWTKEPAVGFDNPRETWKNGEIHSVGYDLVPEQYQNVLIRMNDSQHKNFADIANFIEKNIEVEQTDAQ